MATKQEIEARQIQWDFLNHLQGNWKRALNLAKTECDLALSERQYVEAFDRGCEAEQEIEAYEVNLRELEDWLIDAGAPGWVAT